MGTVAFVMFTTTCYVAPVVFYCYMRYRYPEHSVQLDQALVRYGNSLDSNRPKRTLVFRDGKLMYKDKLGVLYYNET